MSSNDKDTNSPGRYRSPYTIPRAPPYTNLTYGSRVERRINCWLVTIFDPLLRRIRHIWRPLHYVNKLSYMRPYETREQERDRKIVERYEQHRREDAEFEERMAKAREEFGEMWRAAQEEQRRKERVFAEEQEKKRKKEEEKKGKKEGEEEKE